MSLIGAKATGHRNGETTSQDTREIIEAKYLLACDGVHSWVRRKLGLRLEGACKRDLEDTDYLHRFLESIPPELYINEMHGANRTEASSPS
jgi:2-polyprenyl-6-methoxyphenol hydroxylase-like FAD-dependent oxidoreductase